GSCEGPCCSKEPASSRPRRGRPASSASPRSSQLPSRRPSVSTSSGAWSTPALDESLDKGVLPLVGGLVADVPGGPQRVHLFDLAADPGRVVVVLLGLLEDAFGHPEGSAQRGGGEEDHL